MESVPAPRRPQLRSASGLCLHDIGAGMIGYFAGYGRSTRRPTTMTSRTRPSTAAGTSDVSVAARPALN